MARQAQAEAKKITFAMLGPSGSGKTVAGCTLFHEMSGDKQYEEEGRFHVAAIGRDLMDLTNKFAQIATYGQFPPGSIENRMYNLLFLSGIDEMCDIQWLDYKGALLHEVAEGEQDDDQQQEEYDELIQNLQHAAVLVLLISGDLLNDYIRLMNRTISDQEEALNVDSRLRQTLNVYQYLFRRINQDAEGIDRKKPIIYWVTKSDLVQRNSDREMMESLKQMLAGYGLLGGHKVVLSHCTLGRRLAYCANNNTITDCGTVQPEGFEIPLLLTVGYAFSGDAVDWERNELARLRKANENEIQRLRSQIDEQKQSIAASANNTIQDNDNNQSTWLQRLRYLFTKKRPRVSQATGVIERATAQIENLTNEINLLTQRSQNLSVQHPMRERVNAIANYINGLNQVGGKCGALYLNEEGQERNIQEFFQQ